MKVRGIDYLSPDQYPLLTINIEKIRKALEYINDRSLKGSIVEIDFANLFFRRTLDKWPGRKFRLKFDTHRRGNRHTMTVYALGQQATIDIDVPTESFPMEQMEETNVNNLG